MIVGRKTFQPLRHEESKSMCRLILITQLLGYNITNRIATRKRDPRRKGVANGRNINQTTD